MTSVINKIPITITHILCCICLKMRKVKFFDKEGQEDRICITCLKVFEKHPEISDENLIEIIRSKKVKELLSENCR